MDRGDNDGERPVLVPVRDCGIGRAVPGEDGGGVITATLERTVERTGDDGYDRAIPVTPRHLLVGRDVQGRSPRDALVQFCDHHAWRIGAIPMLGEGKPLAINGAIYPADRAEPGCAVRVLPVDVALRSDPGKKGTRDMTFYWGGTYRVEVD